MLPQKRRKENEEPNASTNSKEDVLTAINCIQDITYKKQRLAVVTDSYFNELNNKPMVEKPWSPPPPSKSKPFDETRNEIISYYNGRKNFYKNLIKAKKEEHFSLMRKQIITKAIKQRKDNQNILKFAEQNKSNIQNLFPAVNIQLDYGGESLSHPKCQSWVPCSHNVESEDLDVCRFIPYFGENVDNDDIVNDMELFPKSIFTTQFEKTYTEEASYDVTKRFGEDDDVIEILCTLQKKTISIRKLKKIIQEITKLHKEKKPLPYHTIDDILTRHRSLFCRKCYVYKCRVHSEIYFHPPRNAKKIISIPSNPIPCSLSCFKRKKARQETKEKVREKWRKFEESLYAKAKEIFGNDHCKVADLIPNKTCSDIEEFSHHFGSEIVTKKYNALEDTKLRIEKLKELRPKFKLTPGLQGFGVPCYHEFSCKGVECECSKHGMGCEKHCSCGKSCESRSKGCACKTDCKQEKGSGQCACVAGGRDCDPDYCKCRGCLRPDGGSCRNISKTYEHKYLLIGKSKIAGFGIFAGEFIKKGDYITEYLGELITELEGERRGRVYDKRKHSYLFNLTKEPDCVIDATRKGNKSRFINHSNKPNCQPKIRFGIDPKIVIFALSDIQIGEELFIDYQYTEENAKLHGLDFDPDDDFNN